MTVWSRSLLLRVCVGFAATAALVWWIWGPEKSIEPTSGQQASPAARSHANDNLGKETAPLRSDTTAPFAMVYHDQASPSVATTNVAPGSQVNSLWKRLLASTEQTPDEQALRQLRELASANPEVFKEIIGYYQTGTEKNAKQMAKFLLSDTALAPGVIAFAMDLSSSDDPTLRRDGQELLQIANRPGAMRE